VLAYVLVGRRTARLRDSHRGRAGSSPQRCSLVYAPRSATRRERAGAPEHAADVVDDAGSVGATVVATLLAVTVAPFALAIGERSNSYNHLASASFQEHRYYLAQEQTPSDGSLVLLYRCDALGVWCHQIDALGTSVEGQSDSAGCSTTLTTQTLTASEGGYLLLTYPAGDLFAGP